MAAVKELAYVVYEVSDLPAWERFCVDLLGMQISASTGSRLAVRTDERIHRWLLVEGPADDLLASGYEVESSASLDDIVQRLRDAGTEVQEGSEDLARDRGVERIAVTADPMGNRVELVTGLADATTPFESPLLLSSFVNGAGGAGHQVLLSKGVAREDYLAFYQGLLGFRISDVIIEELAPGIVADLIFLHCNPRHHTVALGDMPHPKMTHHFMVEVSDPRDVGLAWDRCLKAGQPFEMTLGMHPNDNMFSFYVRTPSGFSVEYGSGGLLIEDPDSWEIKTFDKLNNWGHFPPQLEVAWLSASTVPTSDAPPPTATA